MDTLGSYGRERALYARRRSNCYLLETSIEGRKSPMGSSEVTLSNQLAENNSSMGSENSSLPGICTTYLSIYMYGRV